MKLILIFIFVCFSFSGNSQYMKRYLQQANALVNNKQYPEALEKYIWFYNNALNDNTSFEKVVQHSFALYYWKGLGDKYPPALQALKDVRDKKYAKLRNCNSDPQLFQDVVEINRSLNADSESIDLFSTILNQCVSLAKLYWPSIDELLYDKNEYCLIQQMVKDPVAEYNQYEENYKLMLLDLSGKHTSSIQLVEEYFISRVIRIIEFSKSIADQKSAQEIKTRALMVVENQKIKSIEVEERTVSNY